MGQEEVKIIGNELGLRAGEEHIEPGINSLGREKRPAG